MRTLISMTDGKVFTLATLDQMIAHTQLRHFLPSYKAKAISARASTRYLVYKSPAFESAGGDSRQH